MPPFVHAMTPRPTGRGLLRRCSWRLIASATAEPPEASPGLGPETRSRARSGGSTTVTDTHGTTPASGGWGDDLIIPRGLGRTDARRVLVLLGEPSPREALMGCVPRQQHTDEA